jgi:glycogen debranching enzyme
VVEVQGYAYAAFKAIAQLTASRNEARSSAYLARAEQLRAAIEQHFWIAEMGFYALALDGAGKPCRVYGSNAGHLLFCGVPSPERAALVIDRLLSKSFCTGWGIRTLAEQQARFNPMSYHNGSIWPHDTSLCAAGIARYGGRQAAAHVLNDVFEAANHFGMRLPELYCGFGRVEGNGPAPYPVACLPQAWSSGSLFMLLQACLGIRIDGQRREVHIERPALPPGVQSLIVRQLPVGDARIDLQFEHVEDKVVAAATTHLDPRVRVLMHL